jgi:peptidyl-tRNA hydrolase, PTH1 family
VRYWLQQEGLGLDRALVVTDDIALPFGKLRLRAAGGAGGHNGLSSIIQLLGREDFARLRFGIGGEFAKGRQVEHVLGAWTSAEAQALPKAVEQAAAAATAWAAVGIERAMNEVNTRT